MRVLLVVTNAFFLASVVERSRVYAGNKRVIIRVPQRIKYIHHHQVKKVPVYVLLPADEKKSKVLDDLQQVSNVLPCKKRERELPWQDDIIDGDDDGGALPKYRYARHYDALDAATASGTGRTYSVKQRDAKKLLQMQIQTPPPPTNYHRYKKVHQDVADYRDIDPDFNYNGEADSHQDSGGQSTLQRQRSKPSLITYAKKNDYDESAVFTASAGAATTISIGKFGHQRGNGAARTRKTRYKNAENGHKDNFDDIQANKLISAENGADDGGGAQQNLIHISYPPTARAPSSFPSTDVSSSFYTNDAASYAPSMAAEAESHQFRHSYLQPSAPQSPSASAPTSANNYASSYQYRVQH